MYIYTEGQKTIQQEVRTVLIKFLKRHNGRVSIDEFNLNFPYPYSNLKDRLFQEYTNDILEWKPNIVCIQDLIRKIGRNKNEIPQSILNIFDKSKELSSRTTFPYLAYARNKNQYSENPYFPVYGIDILIRDPVIFSNNEEANNTFKIGKQAIAYFIHADKDKFMIRANMGKNAMQSNLYQYLNQEIEKEYLNIKNRFYNKEFEELVFIICKASNLAIKKWTFSAI